MMESQADQSAGRASQRIRSKCEEVAIGFDEKIDNLLSGRVAATASKQRQRKCQRCQEEISSREPIAARTDSLPGFMYMFCHRLEFI
jgi:hypothetical protein